MTIRQSPSSPGAITQAYFKTQFVVPARLADEAAGILVGLGALGCSVKWPRRLHARPSGNVTLEAYYAKLSAREAATAARRLRAAGMLSTTAAAPAPQRILDPGWAGLWKTRFKPIEIGRRLIIIPPWDSNPDGAGRMPIIIDPGQGFGTGHHGTTRGTLLAIEKECGRRAITEALDLGTGSGILAFAMKRLGVAHILAVDVDPQALENARHNAALNGLRRGIRFTTTPPRGAQRFELIAANILSSTLIRLAPALKRLLAPGGRLILSGILAREAKSVTAAYRPELRPLWSHTERGWTTLVMGAAPPAGRRPHRSAPRQSSP